MPAVSSNDADHRPTQLQRLHMTHDQMERSFGGGTVIAGRPWRPPGARWWQRSCDRNLWCGRCARAFPNGVYRLLGGGKTCPYADCEASIAQDALEWKQVRGEHHGYPVTPSLGIQYPLRP